MNNGIIGRMKVDILIKVLRRYPFRFSFEKGDGVLYINDGSGCVARVRFDEKGCVTDYCIYNDKDYVDVLLQRVLYYRPVCGLFRLKFKPKPGKSRILNAKSKRFWRTRREPKRDRS